MQAPDRSYSNISITQHNAILQDIRGKLDATIYVTDARVVTARLSGREVTQLEAPLFTRTLPGYLASFFKTNVVASAEEIRRFEDQIIAMIEQHKTIYEANASRTLFTDLTPKETALASQNKNLIKEIIDITRRIFKAQDHEYRVPEKETKEPYSKIQDLKNAIEGRPGAPSIMDSLFGLFS